MLGIICKCQWNRSKLRSSFTTFVFFLFVFCFEKAFHNDMNVFFHSTLHIKCKWIFLVIPWFTCFYWLERVLFDKNYQENSFIFKHIYKIVQNIRQNISWINSKYFLLWFLFPILYRFTPFFYYFLNYLLEIFLLFFIWLYISVFFLYFILIDSFQYGFFVTKFIYSFMLSIMFTLSSFCVNCANSIHITNWYTQKHDNRRFA